MIIAGNDELKLSCPNVFAGRLQLFVVYETGVTNTYENTHEEKY